MSAINAEGESVGINIDTLTHLLKTQYSKLLEERPSGFQPALDSKSTLLAIEFRKLGNEQFKNAHDLEALSWYSKSVATAAEGSEELALAYANRSATSFRLSKYAACLHDVNRALRGQYPEHLKKKLRARKKQCLVEIKQLGQSEAADAADSVQVTDPVEESAWHAFVSNFKNPLIPNASSKIKVECDEQWGRYMTAADDIEPGEILSSQQFAALVLQPELRYENCSYCLAKCRALIPCLGCSQVMYCSVVCRERAHNSYHRTECKFISLKPMSDLEDYELTALRVLLIGSEQGVRLPDLMMRLTKHDIFREKDDPTNQPFVNDYLAVLKLCRTFQPSRVVSLAPKAVEIVALLKSIGFFRIESAPQEANELSEAELFAALLYANHATATKSNMFAITPVVESDLLHKPCDKEYGFGVCTLHNLLNHSCDPDVRFFTRNREHVLLAIRPIHKGQQIFYTYFNSFASNPIVERNRVLSMFGFTCHCNACCNLWPLETDLYKRKIEVLCDRKRAVEEYLNMKRSIAGGDVMKLSDLDILRFICRLCEWLHINVRKPSASLIHCECLIYNFVRLLHDDFSKACMNEDSRKYVEQTLSAIEKHLLKSLLFLV